MPEFRSQSLVRSAGPVLFVLLLIFKAHAHHDVNAAVKLLTQKIDKTPTADLYYQRATEYRALRLRSKAIADLHTALRLDVAHFPGRLALIHLFHETGDIPGARKEVAFAQQQNLKVEQRAQVHALGAEVWDDEPAVALAHSVNALSLSHHPPVGWYLRQAYLYERTGQARPGLESLKKGYLSTKSIVLRNAWLDALLSSGQWQEAFPIIDHELKTSRFRASWLIRRARIYLLQQKKEKAQTDLQVALTELDKRISSTHPDLTLIHDRGLTRVLMGQKEAARKDLALLEKSTFSPLSYALLKSYLD